MSLHKCVKYIWHDSKYSECTSPKNCSFVETCNNGSSCQTIYIQNNTRLVWQISGCAFPQFCQVESHISKCILKHSLHNAYQCCCTQSECNRDVIINATHMKPRPTAYSTTPILAIKPQANENSNKVFYYVPPIFVFFILISVLFCIWKRHKKSISLRNPLLSTSPPPTPPIENKAIHKQEIVFRGQFGCVWKAVYDNKLVAVKIIQAHEKSSFEAEKLMYCEYKLSHDSILNFVAAENRLEDGIISYWIITEFHSNGSLADFLHVTVLDFDCLINLAISMVAGLAYLHAQQVSTNPIKPVICHRDFKSRNVLVKNNLRCCISDFRSACAFYPGVENEEAKAQVGTKRYMAPEVLRGAKGFSAEAFLCVDVYALALVMWELLSRCNEAVPAEPYRAPYEEEVGIHPAIEDMRHCVLDKKVRPHLKDEWKIHEKLGDVCDTIEDCWDDDGDARLTSLCVHERLIKLTNRNHPYDQLQHPTKEFNKDRDDKLTIELSDMKAELSYSSIASSRRTLDTSCS